MAQDASTPFAKLPQELLDAVIENLDHPCEVLDFAKSCRNHLSGTQLKAIVKKDVELHRGIRRSEIKQLRSHDSYDWPEPMYQYSDRLEEDKLFCLNPIHYTARNTPILHHMICNNAPFGTIADVIACCVDLKAVSYLQGKWGVRWCPPLYAAIESGRLDVVEALLDNGCDVNEVPKYNRPRIWDWLTLAVRAKQEAIAVYLIDRGLRTFLRHIWEAASVNSSVILKRLLEETWVKESEGHQRLLKMALHRVARDKGEDMEAARVLISAGLVLTHYDVASALDEYNEHMAIFLLKLMIDRGSVKRGDGKRYLPDLGDDQLKFTKFLIEQHPWTFGTSVESSEQAAGVFLEEIMSGYIARGRDETVKYLTRYPAAVRSKFLHNAVWHDNPGWLYHLRNATLNRPLTTTDLSHRAFWLRRYFRKAIIFHSWKCAIQLLHDGVDISGFPQSEMAQISIAVFRYMDRSWLVTPEAEDFGAIINAIERNLGAVDVKTSDGSFAFEFKGEFCLPEFKHRDHMRTCLKYDRDESMQFMVVLHRVFGPDTATTLQHLWNQLDKEDRETIHPKGGLGYHRSFDPESYPRPVDSEDGSGNGSEDGSEDDSDVGSCLYSNDDNDDEFRYQSRGSHDYEIDDYESDESDEKLERRIHYRYPDHYIQYALGSDHDSEESVPPRRRR
ncbi:hypothetical protein SCUP515_02700 [Seiridium cupressi]